MRIGLVIETFDPARGGAEHWTYQFAARLLSLGHEVHVAARQFADSTPNAIHKHELRVNHDRMKFAEAAQQALEPLSLDVVHDMGAGYYGDIFQPHGGSRAATFEANLQLLPAWIRPIKRKLSLLLPRYREFERLNARQYEDRGQLIIALSRMVVRDMLYHHDVSAHRIRLVYNGVDIDRFSPAHRSRHRDQVRKELRVSPETMLLLIAAHNFRLKGVATLIRALGQLLDQGKQVHLAVAGGKRLKRWQRMADREASGENVTFLGSVSDMVPLYSAADVYVQPTFYDPCSLVVLEALASGLPVITTTFNGVSEIISNKVQGFVMKDPADSDELASLLLPLFDQKVRETMGKAARELAIKHSLARNCQEILAVYSELTYRKGMAA